MTQAVRNRLMELVYKCSITNTVEVEGAALRSLTCAAVQELAAYEKLLGAIDPGLAPTDVELAIDVVQELRQDLITERYVTPQRQLYEALERICRHNHLCLDTSDGARLGVPVRSPAGGASWTWHVSMPELAGLPMSPDTTREAWRACIQNILHDAESHIGFGLTQTIVDNELTRIRNQGGK